MRPWRDEDLEPFAGLNADPLVMEHMPKLLSRTASDELASGYAQHLRQHGFGMWAVELLRGAPFIGFVGIAYPRLNAHFTPCVEVGWRLAHEYWGNGYATEAAQKALALGFDEFGLREIIAYTAARNDRSRAVMKRLRMQRDPSDDFDHPNMPSGDPLRPHVLYRLQRRDWEQATEC